MDDKFLQYTAIELALEPGFIHWVKAGQPDDGEWGQWIRQNPTMTPVIAEAGKLIHILQFKEPSLSVSRKDALLERIKASSQQEPVIRRLKPAPQHYFLRYVYSVAAVAAGIALFYVFVWNNTSSSKNITSSYGQKIAHLLPDNSKVNLNAGSTIQYEKRHFLENRSLHLDGEAFFEVEKGSRFMVNTTIGKVEVLGTSFNVYCRKDSLMVHCISGKVKVSAGQSLDTAELSAGQLCTIGREGVLKSANSATPSPTWIEGLIQFDKRPMEEVFEELERQFDIRINTTAAIKDSLYTGFFHTGNLEKALESVCWPMNLEYEAEGKEVRVR